MKLYMLAFIMWLVAAFAYTVWMLQWGWVLPLSFAVGVLGNFWAAIWSKPFIAWLRDRHMRRVLRAMHKRRVA